MSQSHSDNCPGGFAILEECNRTKTAVDQHGQEAEFHSLFTEAQGKMLYEIIRREQPELCLEVGMAWGSSTLYILQALADNGKGRLITCDPGQFNPPVNGIGVENVKRAGYSEFHQFVADGSEIVLPLLHTQIRAGEHPYFDFVFIDGNHKFDQTMVEFFYTDKILNVGGCLAMDDFIAPAVWTATKYWEANRHYFTHPIHSEDGWDGDNTDSFRAFHKLADDDRPWWHFVPFPVSLEPYKGDGVRPKLK